MSLTYGAMFAGYGGLEMGVQSVLGGNTLWHAEFEAAPSKILAHHWPGIPNLGDVTKVDWTTVPKVDVITGGSPCQDLSHAGKRKGMTDGTRSNLWVEMREAIAVIRPRLVVWENVRGALSACADSDMGQCPRCVDEDYPGGHAPHLRAIGRVVGDLAELGYVGRYYGLRAADVGGAHGRFRVFLFAEPADAHGSGLQGLADQTRAAQAERLGHTEPSTGRSALTLLPTPAVNDMGAGKTPDAWDAWADRMRAEHGNGNGHGKSLEIEAMRLLPTPRCAYGMKADLRPHANDTSRLEDAVAVNPSNIRTHFPTQDWAQYETAIRRHEQALGRPAPPPTEPGAKGQPRLSSRFVEWLMMLPEGHVVGRGLTRNEELKALGNGVVPPQAAAATRAFVQDTAMERVA